MMDGLNNLWEQELNWDRLNGEGDDVEEEENVDEENFVDSYLPVIFDRNTFHPVQFAEIPPLAYYGEVSVEEREFLTLRDLLSRHLHYTYATGNLRWPKVRKNCVQGVLDLNQVIREHFPGAGDDVDEV